jgi:maleate cis-trans isomerase
MTDVLGFRATMGVIIPSVNAVVESDFWDMWIPGVSFHTGSMDIAQLNLSSDSAMKDLLAQLVHDKDLRGPSAAAIAEITPKVYAFGVLLSEY